MTNNGYKFSGKYIIKADLRCITGLHIGGIDEGFEIGGMDNPVIKDPITGYPYIPGSSIKGKIRSLLEWTTKCRNNLTCVEHQVEEFEKKKKALMDKIANERDLITKKKMEDDLKKISLSIKHCECGSCDVCIIFGCSASTTVKEPTRLSVRDSFPKGLYGSDGKIKPEEQRDGTIATWKTNLGENIYTEVKTENAIDRLTSAANPRPMERVPTESVFEVEFLFDIYKDDDVKRIKKIFEGMMLLQDSSLGGGGSRGSGKVVFENIRIIQKGVDYYTENKDGVEINKNGPCAPREIHAQFESIFK
jgi:CRISPR-associated protein Csm3